MKKFKGTKKIIALLLSLSLITGMMPATAWNAFAAEEKTPIDAAIIFTDLHTNKSNNKQSTIEAFFGNLRTTNLPFSSVTSGGDAFSVNKDSDGTKYDGYTDTISGYIRGEKALNDSDIPINYVWSDHDRYAYNNATEKTPLDKTSHVSYGKGPDGKLGTDDDSNYYVYSLSMGDMSTDDRYSAGFVNNRTSKGFTKTVDQAIDNFEADVVLMKKDRPLFIVSHQPLLARRGDNGHAAKWCEAINTVASSMDVAFFFGHNHNHDSASDYYYAKGSNMKVAQKNGDKTGTSTKINFTHMCAGYMAPGSTGTQADTTRQDTVVVAKIYEDKIQYTTYDKDGVYNGKYALNETVTRAYAAKPAKKELTSISITTHPTKTTYTVGEAFDKTGMVVTASYSDNSTASVTGYTVTTDDMSTAGTKEVTVTYTEGTVTKTATFNIVVEAADTPVVPESPTVPDEETSGNDFPAYPNPGSVELYKTATPLDQNTGLTRVDLSTSGLPVSKGVDVIVMLDTSSSMDRCVSCGKYTGIYSDGKGNDCTCKSKVTRLDELKVALEDLETALKSSSNPENIRVAVTDFNGMYKTGPCAYDTSDRTKDVAGLTNAANTQVFTNPNSDLDLNAFISASELDVSEFNLTGTVTHTGTNYDYAYDAIYRLGYAIRQDNIANNQTDRELYVLFMSDGAPNQYNYYITTGGSSNTHKTDWRHWLNGNVEDNGGMNGTIQCQTHSYYYDEATKNAHRMATAIKGDPNTLYNVIRKDISDLGSDVFIKPTGDDEYAGKANMYKVNGLGAHLYSLAFYVGADGATTADDAKATLRKNASDNKYVDASSGEELAKAFHDIGTEIAYAATNAVFTDIMGDDFKLQLGTTVKSNATDATKGKETVDTDIIVKTENVYIPSQVGTTVLGHLVTNADVGKPYGDPTELERVEFNEDGTVATSSQLEGNILKDGVICAKTFVYNTNPLEKEVELADGNKIKLGPDEFYWTVGTINQKRFTLSYMAYLTGSMEGTRESGSFKTNNLAELTYVNWLGNTVSQTVASPVVAWGKAQVKYAFYLVNEHGQPVYANGEIAPNFEKAYKVTNPVVYNSIKLNGAVKLLSTEGSKVLPSEYTLYDEVAAYEVRPLSGDGYGEQCGWTITAGSGKTLTETTSTTYVTGYNGNAYTNVMSVHEGSYAYTDTTVYFAVTWSTKALPDTVVVDYGLPVDISVLANDMFAQKTLAAVGPVVDKVNKAEYVTTLSEDFGSSKNFTYGKAEANVTKDKVRYTPTTMEMNGYDKFAYAVKSTGAGTSDQVYYYGTVTVIPATTIYYEEDFITYNDITWQQKEGGLAWEGEWAVKEVTNPEDSVWRTEGEKKANAVQGEDRPGQYSLADANHIYGYDAVNKGMSTYSLGSAKVATVTGNDGAQAQFTFWGTGFDIISMTNNTTGAILVDVEKKVDGKWTTFDNYVVDTYYGYKQVAGDADKNGTIEKGEVIWEVDPNAEDSLYQVPVIKMVNKEYGQYRVTIKATYEQFFDHVDGSSAYDFYLDAIRIYDPANDGASDGTTDTTIEDAYKADGEGWPSYIELRNKLIDTEKKFGGIWGSDDPTTEDEDERTVVEGLVFIDGDDSVGDNQITDYKNYGPNNEVYLKPGQRVAFMVNAPNNLANIHIGIKSADGIPATYTITNIAREDSADGKVKAGDYYNPKTATIDTATDMYYDMTPWKGNIVVISNTGDRYGTTGAISLTNIKSTYTSDPNGQETTGDAKSGTVEPRETSIYMTPAAATLTLRSLNTPIVPEEPETPVDPETPVVPDTPVEPEEPETPPVVEEPEEPVAAPAKIISLKTDKQNYVQGDKVKVTVTTNKEATKVKVGTKVLKNFTTKNGNRTWTTTVNANKLGKLTIGAIAYNSKGTATKKVTKVVTVKKFAPRIFNVTLNKYKVKKGQKYTVTVKAGSSVKHVRVNGKKITKFTTKNGVKTFKVTFKANKVGKQKVKVIAYNKALYPSNPKFRTVTVTRK